MQTHTQFKICPIGLRGLVRGNLGLFAPAFLALALAVFAIPAPVAAGELAGALIGGAIGSQVGKGRGQIAATAAGAYLGSKAGERQDDPNAPGINAGNVAGAVVGGAIGSQFGGGNGRLAATAAGAVIGSNVADRASENARRRTPRAARRAASNDYDESAGYAPAQQYYRPQVQYQSSEPGSAVEVRGSGY